MSILTQHSSAAARRKAGRGVISGGLLALAASFLMSGCYIPVQGVREPNPPAGVSPPWPHQAEAIPPAPPRDPFRGQGETPPPPQGNHVQAYADWLFDGPEGRGFTYYLAQGYRRLAKLEDHEHDFVNAARFLARAASADRQELVEPEYLFARTLPLYAVDDLVYARQRLVTLLGNGAGKRFPKLSAQAQVMFDCWMEQQEENSEPQEVARCRNGFEAALARLESAYREKTTTPAAPPAACAPQPCAPQACAPCPAGRTVHFELDKADLTAEAKQAIAEVVRELKLRPGAMLAVAGHTDRAGTDKHNDSLSKRRLDAVVEALLAAGVPREALARTGYFGESRPRVPTPDGVRLVDNRRVEIHIRCGQRTATNPEGAACAHAGAKPDALAKP